jgi:hypothetical protein
LDDSDGLNHFGICLELRQGVRKDLPRANNYYKAAAANRNTNAQFNYRFYLQHRLGVTLNLAAALRHHAMSMRGDVHPGEFGASERTHCVQYGGGFDVVLNGLPGRHSFRCLRVRAIAPYVETSMSSESNSCRSALSPVHELDRLRRLETKASGLSHRTWKPERARNDPR